MKKIPSSSKHLHNPVAVAITLIFVLASLYLFVSYASFGTASNTQSFIASNFTSAHTAKSISVPMSKEVRAAASFHLDPKAGVPAIGSATAPPAQAPYDEQIGITFTQNFNSIAYNVTAVQQQDSDGFGPAYLLQGISSAGYWYQIGLAWNWPYLTGGYLPGFTFLYEVFDPNANSIYPTGGGGGLGTFSGPVNSGEKVLLSLNFTGGNVTMYAHDWNTGASGQESYSAEGANIFVGLPSAPANSNGFFTGLMTEQYHSAPYFGSQQSVSYGEPTSPLSSAWQWIDEYNVNTLQSEFASSSFASFSSNPTQLQIFSLNGATQAASAYDFITGSITSVQVTLSYTVLGGGTGYSPPTLSYISNGVQQSATLTTSPKAYSIDSGTSWSVTGLLGGSTSTERWITNETTTATATSPESIVFVYNHQYLVTIGASPQSAGSTIPSPGAAWFNAESTVTISAVPDSPYFLSIWTATQTISIANPSSSSTNALINGSGSITANYATISISLNPASSKVTQGSSVQIATTLKDAGEPVSLSVSGLPSGATASWSSNPLTPTTSGVSDNLTITTTFSTPAGSYDITVTISAAGGGTSSTHHTLTIRQATALTLSYSVQGSGSGYSPPMISFEYNGVASQTALGTTPITIHADQNTQWNISSTLPGSTQTERWAANQSSTSGTASSPATMSFVYYHQYLAAFSFTVSGVGRGYSPPSVAYTEFGSKLSAQAGQKVWVDASSAYSYANPLAGSTQSERWEAGNSSASGTITSAASVSPTYYHQYALSAGYSIGNGGGSPSTAPVLTTMSFGSAQPQNLGPAQKTYWADAGSNYNASSVVMISSQERWITNQTTSGAVSSSNMSLNFVYDHQYYLSIQPNALAGGTVSPQSGWINSGDSVSISSAANSGWKFEYWAGLGSGSYSGNSSVSTVKLLAPINESATFYPGLIISAAGSGSVSYSFGSSSGSVRDQPETVYVPYGDTVSITANPSSALYRLDYWAGETSGNSSHSSIVMDSPNTVVAHFNYNYYIIGGIVIALAGGMVTLAAVVRRRRRTP